MNKITKMTAGKSREKRVNVFLDGKFTFSLPVEVALKEGLRKGHELSASQVKALIESDHYHRCLNTALRYLSYRPRSEAEMSQRLQQRGYNSDCMRRVMAKLREQGLIDDTTFARFWTEHRESFRPQSRQMTRMELQRKGLDGNIIEQVISDTVVDSDNAYRAALNRAGQLFPSDYRIFRRRLGEYLRRRGFGYELINKTIDRVWKELGSQPE